MKMALESMKEGQELVARKPYMARVAIHMDDELEEKANARDDAGKNPTYAFYLECAIHS